MDIEEGVGVANRFLAPKMPFLCTFCLNCDNSGFTSETNLDFNYVKPCLDLVQL